MDAVIHIDHFPQLTLFPSSCPSLVKQVCMCTRSGSRKNQLALVNRIDKQPVGPYVAFTKTCVISCERMVMILLIKLCSVCEFLKHSMEPSKVITTLLDTLVVFLELRSWDNS